jgi:hypothetical protein
MKHFFSVPRIVFVLSIDKNHLASAVRGFYGSEKINTDEYLRRFIDLDYSIPKPPNKVFSKYLFDYYSFNEFFSSTERREFSEFKGDGESLLKMAELLFYKSNATLRQQEKIFGQTRLILRSFSFNQYTFSPLLFVLVFLNQMESEVYSKIERKVFSIQELSKTFADLMPPNIENLYDINLIYVEALLLHFYNNNQDVQDRIKLYDKDAEGKTVSLINSNLELKRTSLASCFNQINQKWDYNDLSLNFLLNKINLTAPIIM